jgi:hypothetical protein
MNISPSSCDYWGVNWLGDDNLFPGGSIPITAPPGTYDIMVEVCTQSAVVFRNLKFGPDNELSLNPVEGSGISDCKASLTVINRSAGPICHIRIAGPASESFGLNLLGRERIGSGDSRRFILPEGTYDVKAEDCDFKMLRVDLGLKILAD